MKLTRTKIEWVQNPDKSLGWELRLKDARGKRPDLNDLPKDATVLIVEDSIYFIELEETERTHIQTLFKDHPEKRFLCLTDMPVQFDGRHFPRNVWMGYKMKRQSDILRLGQLTREMNQKFLVLDLDEGVSFRYGTLEWIIVGNAKPMPKYIIDNLVDDIKRYNIRLYVRLNITYKKYPKEIPWIGDTF